MKKIISVLLTLVMTLGILSAAAVSTYAAGNYVPSTVSLSETGGKFSSSYSNRTLTYNANGSPIDNGIAYAFISLSDAGTQNRNIMLTDFSDEIKYCMSNVCRSGKVKKIIVHNYVDHYNSSTDTINITASNGLVTKITFSKVRYYKGGKDSQQVSTGTYTYTYNDAGNLTKINWHAGSEAEKTEFSYDSAGRLAQSVWTCGVGKEVVTNYTLDNLGRVTNYGGIQISYNALGRCTRIGTVTFAYNSNGTLKTSTDHTVENKAAATYSYTYRTI